MLHKHSINFGEWSLCSTYHQNLWWILSRPSRWCVTLHKPSHKMLSAVKHRQKKIHQALPCAEISTLFTANSGIWASTEIPKSWHIILLTVNCINTHLLSAYIVYSQLLCDCPWELAPTIRRDDVIKWKHFSRYWRLIYGEFTGQRWIPRTKASDARGWCFRWSAPEGNAE